MCVFAVFAQSVCISLGSLGGPCCLSCAMVRRSPSKIMDVAFHGGALWASGTFGNMLEWCHANGIQRVVNLLRYPDVPLRSSVPDYTHMDFNVEYQERILEVLKEITSTVYAGGNVLVHCQHGLHRTGAVITLWLALMLATGDMAKQSVQSLLSTQSWRERLQEAFDIWSMGRQLQ